MIELPGVTILANPSISPSQLFRFYRRNNICEANFGEAVAAKVLTVIADLKVPEFSQFEMSVLFGWVFFPTSR